MRSVNRGVVAPNNAITLDFVQGNEQFRATFGVFIGFHPLKSLIPREIPIMGSLKGTRVRYYQKKEPDDYLNGTTGLYSTNSTEMPVTGSDKTL
ncbi:hypothetical protein PAENIP36_48410 [Paenibacillus sp. P36]